MLPNVWMTVYDNGAWLQELPAMHVTWWPGLLMHKGLGVLDATGKSGVSRMRRVCLWHNMRE